MSSARQLLASENVMKVVDCTIALWSVVHIIGQGSAVQYTALYGSQVMCTAVQFNAGRYNVVQL